MRVNFAFVGIGLALLLLAQESRTTAAGSPPPPPPSPYVFKSVAIHGGGFVCGIVPDLNRPGVLYARTDVGGAYRWDALQKSWLPLTDWISQTDGNLLGCESIAIDPSDSDRIYMALGMYTNSWGGNGAIVRSSDCGATFQRTNMPFKMGGNCPGRSCGERLGVDPNDGRVLFFGSRDAGLWKSTDRARTWMKIGAFPAAATSQSSSDEGRTAWPIGISFVQFDRATGKPGSPTPVIYAGVCTQQTSLFRSTDGGSTWNAVAGQPVGLRPNHLAVASDGMFYLSYGNQPGPNGITDGALWMLNPHNSLWKNITPVKPRADDPFGYGDVTVDLHHPGTVMTCSIDRWGHGDTVFRSTDGGEHWTDQIVGGHNFVAQQFSATDAPWAKSLSPHWLGGIQIDPGNPDHVLFVTGYGIWASLNATALDRGEKLAWFFQDRGLEETVPLEMISPPSGPHLISVIGDFDGFTHDDLDASPGRGRHTPHVGTTTGLDFAGAMPRRIVRAGGRGRGFYSNDGGSNWTEFASKPPGAKTGGEIAISSDGKAILWQCGARLTYRSGDLGNSWSPCQGLAGSLQPVSDKSDADLFYALDPRSGQLFVSRDGGQRFSAGAGDLPSGGGTLRSVPGCRGELWLAIKGRLLRSTDAGQNFNPVISVDHADKIGFGKSAPGSDHPSIFMSGTVANTHGLFRSDDIGKSWVRIDDDQHRYGYLNVVIGDPRIFGRVYIGTSGRGIIYGDLSAQVGAP